MAATPVAAIVLRTETAAAHSGFVPSAGAFIQAS